MGNFFTKSDNRDILQDYFNNINSHQYKPDEFHNLMDK